MGSLRIIPENSQLSSINNQEGGESSYSAPGLNDLFKNGGPSSLSDKINDRHPLENQIKNWESTQLDLKMEQYRRLFGLAEPLKRTMELEIVNRIDFRPEILGGTSNLHRDILLNKDCSIDWEDIYQSGIDNNEFSTNFHSEMERKMGI
ncbi:Ump1p [Ascoidea rubescens DSM 1968]|uniref:Proteasome maturation factor n=1 Tax=Ascoidea rubescens DSM 1968 TaxID=1344418 RepID=A0A1D2VE96_9ASCO|nr:proteasome maturation factor [Ascoidea rubescens DSM 1968]ODV59840.1 proteasome maturation factor [Ascoidea rubescens DSM 1968]